MKRARIAPSVMCLSQWSKAEETLELFQQEKIDLLHADVMDGHFVPNLMLGTQGIRDLRKASQIPLDIHLMIEKPEDKISWFDIQPGENVSVHAESTCHLEKALAQIRSLGAHPVVALNPATPLMMLEEVLDEVDGILIMTVNPGFAGQKMVPGSLEKIRRACRMLAERNKEEIFIEVDGNVSFENARLMREAGADIFVGGTSSIFSKDSSLTENIDRLRRSIQ